MKVVVGELDWCKYVGVKSYDDILSSYHPFFSEKFDNIKDVSEVIAWEGEPRDVDLAILKVWTSCIYEFISSARSYYTHTYLLLVPHHHPTFSDHTSPY